MISVVIPTYNRSHILKQCLYALGQQTIPKNEFEVIIINDGSTDDTEKTIFETKKELNLNINYFKQNNEGQGKARNLGIKKAQGEIIVFIGDDIFVKPNFLEEHLLSHKEHPKDNEAVLGYTTWHPNIKVNFLMNFLEHGGHQFAYDNLKNKKIANFHYFYTSNISLKRNILLKHKFDEDFKKYGWEDIELGYRLEKEENLILYYNPQAMGYHYHEVEKENFRQHMQSIGRSAYIFHQKHPELNKIPQAWKYFLIKTVVNPISMAAFHLFNKNFYYKLLTKKYFLEGLEEAIANSKKLQ